MKIVTGTGQLKVGDTIKIIGKNIADDRVCTVKDVLSRDGREEIIIHKKLNKYFITDLLLKGESWAKQVQIVEK